MEEYLIKYLRGSEQHNCNSVDWGGETGTGSQVAGVCDQSGPTLLDSTDCSLPGSSAHGIFWARNTRLPFPSQGIFPTQQSICISCIAGGFFTTGKISVYQESFSPSPQGSQCRLQTLSPAYNPGDLGLSTRSHCLQYSHVQTGNLGVSSVSVRTDRGNTALQPLLKLGTKQSVSRCSYCF